MKKYTKKTVKFYDLHSKEYIQHSAVVLEDKINKFIGFLGGKKILDVACGPGHDTDYLVRKGFDCLGIDLSEKMINFAKKNYKGKFQVMDFFDMKFRDSYFNGIWCSSALVHAEKRDVPQLLKNFNKILRKNGILGIITPSKQDRIKRKNDTRIFTMLNMKDLKKWLADNNFEIIFSKTFIYGNMKWIFIISRKE